MHVIKRREERSKAAAADFVMKISGTELTTEGVTEALGDTVAATERVGETVAATD